jgi:uncharacterized protein
MPNLTPLSFLKSRRPVIGMIHLRPLPGSPRFDGDLTAICDAALRDAAALAEGGVAGVMMENFGDVPFFPGRAQAHVVAAMTALACAVRRAIELPLGINVLRNDGQSAMAIAMAAGAQFIRVNVLCGARVTDQGVINGIAHDLLRDRMMLNAKEIAILADVDVKHSAALAPRPLAEEVADTVERGLADALIVSGTGTGRATDPQHVKAARQAAPSTPLFIGSGVDVTTIGQYLPHADGFIVGTAAKKDGRVENPVDVDRVRELLRRINSF